MGLYSAYLPAEPKQDSTFWRVLELLNRPHSATMGLVSGALTNEDPVGRALAALRGEDQYQGRDVLEALGANPEHLATKIGGFAVDVLNPLDPLNYVGGLGGLTRAGKAAKLTGKLASGWDEAARLGQRAMVSFGGRPVVRGAPTLRGMQQAGQYLQGTRAARGLNELFGGAKGFMRGDPLFGKPSVRKLMGLEEKSHRVSNVYRHRIQPSLEKLGNLKRGRAEKLADMMYAVERGDIGPEELFRAYPKQKEALQGFLRESGQFAERHLGKTGMGAYRSTDAADPLSYHLSYIGRPMAGATESDVAHLLGPPIRYGVREKDNVFNYRLRPAATVRPAPGTIKPEGHEWLERIGRKTAGWDTMNEAERAGVLNRVWQTKMGAKQHKEFLSKYRYSLEELEDLTKGTVAFERRAPVILKSMSEDIAQNVQTDDFIKMLEKEGIATPWEFGTHSFDKGFVMVSEGRWAANPLAIPKEMSTAFTRFVEATSNVEKNGLFYNWLHHALMAWKPVAIYGRGPGYWMRNLVTGTIHNSMEGLDPWNQQTYRMYTKAMKMISAGENSTDVLTLGGRKFQIGELWEAYYGRNMHGHGGFVKTEAGGGPAGALSALFNRANKVTDLTEQTLRLPLMMKVVEDSLDEAARAGMQIGDEVLELAFDNAAERVLRAHFNYGREAFSQFENKWMRGMFVPFYSWTRNNVPYELQKIVTEPGKYMPYVRAYYNSWTQSGVAPEDAPPWLQANLAMPVGKTQEGRDVFLDMTSYLPVFDLVEVADAIPFLGASGQDRNPVQDLIAYGAERFNPFLKEVPEQLAGKDFYTGREFSTEYPREMFGLPIPGGAATTHVAENFLPTLRALDRLNPAGMFTKLGHATGTFTGKRPHRDEPGEAQRWLRFITGLKFYAPDPDKVNWGREKKRRKAKSLRGRARRMRKEGYVAEANYLEELAGRYEVK